MTNIISKDLNLLLVFEALMSERNVSRAAGKLNLSQPALSHALARMRVALGDELFVRVARGVAPTPRALELAPRVAESLEKIRKVFETPEQFNPAKVKLRLTMASTEFIEQVVLPELIPRLAVEAPGITLVSRSTGGSLPKDELERGDYDLAVAGFFGDLPEGFYRQTVLVDEFVCLVRKGHPKVKGQLDLETYVALDHLLISMQGDLRGVVDEALAKKSLSRRVVAGISSFLTPAWVVARTNMILTLPSRLATLYASHLPLQLLPAPLKLPKITMVQVWHERTHGDPLHKWFRRLMQEAVNVTVA